MLTLYSIVIFDAKLNRTQSFRLLTLINCSLHYFAVVISKCSVRAKKKNFVTLTVIIVVIVKVIFRSENKQTKALILPLKPLY